MRVSFSSLELLVLPFEFSVSSWALCKESIAMPLSKLPVEAKPGGGSAGGEASGPTVDAAEVGINGEFCVCGGNCCGCWDI